MAKPRKKRWKVPIPSRVAELRQAEELEARLANMHPDVQHFVKYTGEFLEKLLTVAIDLDPDEVTAVYAMSNMLQAAAIGYGDEMFGDSREGQQ